MNHVYIVFEGCGYETTPIASFSKLEDAVKYVEVINREQKAGEGLDRLCVKTNPTSHDLNMSEFDAGFRWYEVIFKKQIGRNCVIDVQVSSHYSEPYEWLRVVSGVSVKVWANSIEDAREKAMPYINQRIVAKDFGTR